MVVGIYGKKIIIHNPNGNVEEVCVSMSESFSFAFYKASLYL